MRDYYYYEPASGHGLPHDPFNAIVGPRPIGWVGTEGADGTLNLAPYSFFNAFCYRPPIIGFASAGEKHSLRNAHETGEFVWNMVTHALAHQMNQTSASVDYGIDELALAGLTALPSRLVAPPRVGESPVQFECKATSCAPPPAALPAAGWCSARWWPYISTARCSTMVFLTHLPRI
jgi:flavin reductase (DIM6/NTAB) family NADH-FMN oxidoreductase RutF